MTDTTAHAVPSSRRSRRRLRATAVLVAAALPVGLLAAQVTLPHTFSNGSVASAGEVNANFAALEAAVNDHHDRYVMTEDTDCTNVDNTWVDLLTVTLPAAGDYVCFSKANLDNSRVRTTPIVTAETVIATTSGANIDGHHRGSRAAASIPNADGANGLDRANVTGMTVLVGQAEGATVYLKGLMTVAGVGRSCEHRLYCQRLHN